MKISTDMVRKAIRALGDGGREVSYRQVYEALGLSSEAEQAVVRSRAADMKRHGEIQPVHPLRRRPLLLVRRTHNPR